MKTLSIATIVITLSTSIAANAALKVGDTLVLKKDLQSINESSILINGKEASPLRSFKTSACGIAFTDRGHNSNPIYSKGTVFTVKSVEKSLSKSEFLFSLYRGVIDIKLQPKDGASEEVVRIGCSTNEPYATKIAASLKTPSQEDVLATFNNLF
jgi:hypothetical protein